MHCFVRLLIMAVLVAVPVRAFGVDGGAFGTFVGGGAQAVYGAEATPSWGGNIALRSAYAFTDRLEWSGPLFVEFVDGGTAATLGAQFSLHAVRWKYASLAVGLGLAARWDFSQGLTPQMLPVGALEFRYLFAWGTGISLGAWGFYGTEWLAVDQPIQYSVVSAASLYLEW